MTSRREDGLQVPDGAGVYNSVYLFVNVLAIAVWSATIQSMSEVRAPYDGRPVEARSRLDLDRLLAEERSKVSLWRGLFWTALVGVVIEVAGLVTAIRACDYFGFTAANVFVAVLLALFGIVYRLQNRR